MPLAVSLLARQPCASLETEVLRAQLPEVRNKLLPPSWSLQLTRS